MTSLSNYNSPPSLSTKKFINQGLYNWQLTRKNWTALASGKPPIARRVIPTAPTSSILSCLENGRAFESQVPLRVMITILDDERERDGLYG